ncbi:MAG TPA: endolytic transglycosylase MltG, partial [Mycobacteriales bacterium]|nr:endolytic transglycosylase MltG [Mycobacteriales bacterium]
MTDQLGLSEQDEQPTRGPSYGRRRLVVAAVGVAVIVVIVGVLLVGVHAIKSLFGSASDYSGTGYGSVQVQIHPGDSLTAIGSDLADAHVVASGEAFTDAASSNPRASSIGPGYYKLRLHMSGVSAVTLLLDPSSLVQARVVIPEGRRLRDIIATLVQDTPISQADLEAAAKNPTALGVPSWGAGHSLEGFLFPATYNFPPSTTGTQALSAMVTRFNQEMTSIHLVADAHATGLSPYQVLTLASIIEREG